MADSVESLIGAHFLSNDNLYLTLKWINDIKLVPLEAINMIEQFKVFTECTFAHLKKVNLQTLPFTKEENLASLF